LRFGDTILSSRQPPFQPSTIGGTPSHQLHCRVVLSGHPPELLDGSFLLDLVFVSSSDSFLFPGRKINLGPLWASV
jgi:hypothetical protein